LQPRCRDFLAVEKPGGLRHHLRKRRQTMKTGRLAMNTLSRCVILISITGLTGCGGGGYKKADRVMIPQSQTSMSASGPISRACMASGRKDRSPQLCGCIQAAADFSLSNRDQSLAASFYDDPHKAQEIRQSDRASDERFWRKYREYGETAEALCSG